MDFKSRRLKYIGPECEGYESGKEYYILIQQMSDGRYCTFKSSYHYNEEPGYRVHKSMDDIKTIFQGLWRYGLGQ